MEGDGERDGEKEMKTERETESWRDRRRHGKRVRGGERRGDRGRDKERWKEGDGEGEGGRDAKGERDREREGDGEAETGTPLGTQGSTTHLGPHPQPPLAGGRQPPHWSPCRAPGAAPRLAGWSSGPTGVAGSSGRNLASSPSKLCFLSRELATLQKTPTVVTTHCS